jgi:LacI family repressor for deo operon, udp, cdd, tsx, nupC, and nupG
MADVAREAGVSMATASRALSEAQGVAPSTRARVLAAAERLAYVVSPEASALKAGRTGRVGVLVPHLSRWFFGEMLEGIERSLRRARLDMLLYVVGDPAERHSFFQHLPARRKVDAIVVVGIPVTEAERERLELLRVAVVAGGGQSTPYPYVSIDDEAAARQAVDHLLFLGHRRIAMIDAIDPNVPDWPIDGRALAYTTALAEAGIPQEDELMVRVPWGAEEGAEGMARLLSLRRPPTAVLAHSDEMAVGALRTLRRAGLSVPQDVSVISIDDHPMAREVDLTTVHQDVRRQGDLAGRMVASVLAGEHPTSVVLPTHLVPRGSTAPPTARARP